MNLATDTTATPVLMDKALADRLQEATGVLILTVADTPEGYRAHTYHASDTLGEHPDRDSFVIGIHLREFLQTSTPILAGFSAKETTK